MSDTKHIIVNKLRRRKSRRQRTVRVLLQSLGWLGALGLYYFLFSLFFDTPEEFELKRVTEQADREYVRLEQRYDSLMMVVDNLRQRDKEVFQILFESAPYDFTTEYENRRAEIYSSIQNQSSRTLKHHVANKVDKLQLQLTQLNDIYHSIDEKIAAMGKSANAIPSIQPVINDQLSLLTTSYGMRIHPFYKALRSHQGVDYTVPEGSSVFATADGVVKEVSTNNSTSGKSVTIDHGNGYSTCYKHLKSINVRRGASVRRGDIIAQSGNTGLSLAPHLHYEVLRDGVRVDPIHYFFGELTSTEYQRLVQIAQSGMQSFD